jgi:Family of unknown function (DUF5519)
MAVRGAQKRIVSAVTSWDEVEIGPHRYGGLEFRLGKRELGHIHGDALVDIPFPKAVRDEIVEARQAEPHHIIPNSGWVSIFLRASDDVDRAIQLLERSFQLAAAHRKGKAVAS